jgi:hypothetical protein
VGDDDVIFKLKVLGRLPEIVAEEFPGDFQHFSVNELIVWPTTGLQNGFSKIGTKLEKSNIHEKKGIHNICNKSNICLRKFYKYSELNALN